MTSRLTHVEPYAEAEMLCPAKVNLALSVGAAQENGYHPIVSWMVAVDFWDQLSVQCIEGIEDRYHISFSEDASVRQAVDWDVEKDLVYKAHQLMKRRVEKKIPPVEVTLKKYIPAGAGLGGGSSDAAGMLVGLNELFELGIGDDDLIAMGAELGCDVGFAVSAFLGKPSAMATGYGEVIEAMTHLEPVHLALIMPNVGCATAEVYNAFDEMSEDHKDVDHDGVWSLIKGGKLKADGPFNDLAEAAEKVQPRLGELRGRIYEAVHKPVHVTGSGSAMFVIGESKEDARKMMDIIVERCDVACIDVQTLKINP
ncbi:4-diphosphocytidyl-2-C-methyl-D-erythritol kinase [Poriferisphaera corsica]|uniref:4-diphosphocytidyl-2-C-methyl-D-erythritol kinase n=1 Tax=Poriferisphaera corsica TaxID=2528020 RepID=A0A517YUE3_9BACT|nr:4-(cytidine 5'-diphospho)-2-C-methyl-D-erythritol kinase [Poriferisphaera corsica]QDU33864.1 4-diphosphocytidyl-2-C-methyl-D-erythritol kinase [Poriferisphaera corsica]